MRKSNLSLLMGSKADNYFIIMSHKLFVEFLLGERTKKNEQSKHIQIKILLMLPLRVCFGIHVLQKC